MDVGQILDSGSNGKMGSAMITIILAGFLWVGKTTFEHVGQIAGIRHELNSTHQDDKSLRSQYDEIVSMLNERTKSRFTREDAEKLRSEIKEVEGTHNALKDSFLRDYTDLKIEIASIAALPASSPGPGSLGAPPASVNSVATTQHIRRLEGEITNLLTELVRMQRQVGLSRGNYLDALDSPPTLVAQPNLDQLPVTRR